TPPDRADPIKNMPSGAIKVLVADDVENVRRLYKKILNHMGFSVIEAGDGDTAIDLWRKENPALVLLDLNMPRKDGTEILRERKAEELGGEVIVISGKKDTETVREVVAHEGIVGYMTKPININELRTRIEQVMTTPRARAAIGNAVASGSPEKAKPSVSDEDSRQIVIYDNGPYARTLYRGILESLGHQVACAKSGEEASLIMEEGAPDLLVVSLEEGDAGGFATIEAAKKHGVKSIIIVGEGLEPLEKKMREYALGPVLSKPVRLGTFRWAVEQAFSESKPIHRESSSNTFCRIVEEQLVRDHAYTIFDFAKDLSAVLPEGAKETFDRRLENGSMREIQTAITNLLRKLRSDGKTDLGVRYIKHAFMHGNVEVRNFCLALLRELLQAKEEAEILLKLVTDEDFRIRCQVLERLGELQVKESVPIVVRFLNDDVWKVRKSAAAALEQFDLSMVIEPLILFYSRSSEPFPDRIRNRLLGRTGATEISMLDGLARKSGPEVRAFVAEFLGDLKSKLSVRMLSGLLKDSNPLVRAAAARASGKVNNEKLRDSLFTLLTDANSEVQAAVVDGLCMYKLTPPAFVFLCGLGERGKRISESAVRLLATFNRTEASCEKLLDSLSKQSEDNRRYLSLFLSILFPEMEKLNEVVAQLGSGDKVARRKGIDLVNRAIKDAARSLKKNTNDTRIQRG
ncbi:MAG: response regulator, partial [Planctomycetes bacterium]|nr:response regulator [Planctomycetota bacterium]